MRSIYIFLATILILFPNMAYSMTSVIFFNNIQKVTDINDSGNFSITQESGAYLSFDTLSVVGAENVVLSIFLEDGRNIGETSEFLVYPVGRISQQAEARGLVVVTETNKGDFVDIILPKNFFDGINNPLGLVIRAMQDSAFVFTGLDGTPNAPRLIIEGGKLENINEQQIKLPQQDREILEKILKNTEKTIVNSEKKLYEKPYFTIPLGIILGVLSTILFNILKKFFPSL